jgi:hypothetical protein
VEWFIARLHGKGTYNMTLCDLYFIMDISDNCSCPVFLGVRLPYRISNTIDEPVYMERLEHYGNQASLLIKWLKIGLAGNV